MEGLDELSKELGTGCYTGRCNVLPADGIVPITLFGVASNKQVSPLANRFLGIILEVFSETHDGE